MALAGERATYPDPALFAGLDPQVAARWARYFYSRPRQAGRTPSLKQRVLALYDPFARRDVFPAGIRFCCNVYTGCAHGCGYCYCRNYVRNFDAPRPKRNFRRQLLRDLAELAALELPAVPLHASNSTDPLQRMLERREGDMRFLLTELVPRRSLFSRLTLLTRNPAQAAEPEYLRLLQQLAPLRVEVSLAFADDEARRAYEPHAPSVQQRLAGIRRLCEAGIDTAIRIDPLFPREPLPAAWWDRPYLADYGVPVAQTWDGLRQLVDFAVDAGCSRVIVSPLKVPVGRATPGGLTRALRALYAAPFDGRPRQRGWSLRLPDDYINTHLLEPVLQYCGSRSIRALSCRENLLSTH